MRFVVWQRGKGGLLLRLCLVAALAVGGWQAVDPGAANRAAASVTTVSVTSLRSGWDANQPSLTPASVSSGNFGQVFTTPVDGQVYAQPVVWNGTVLVATENNQTYGIDAVSGAVRWQRSLGPAWPASAISCGDLTPNVGVTSTPVIDPATGVAYLFSKTYDGTDPRTAKYLAHALDVATGNEVTGWPITIAGTAANYSGASFDPFVGLQRAGLLLLDGIVYAGFSSHCGATPSRGWIVGVSTSSPRITTAWTSQASASGTEGNIWQSGGGLLSDGPGRIIFQTDDGGYPAAGPGSAPPANLAQSVVRLAVQADQSLKAVDFFTPYNVDTLNGADLGSGGPAGLPAGFGTAARPHLLVTAGKEGRVYLLDRDNLGGRGQATGGGDLAVAEEGPYDGVWSHPAVWGGDGGWVYITGVGPLRTYAYSLDANGNPLLTLTGMTADRFGFGSGSPIVTSNGTAAGSALLWVVYEPDGTGVGAELRAYDPVPQNFGLNLRWSAPIGKAAKFSVPAVDGGRVYVGTRDGHLLAFGTLAASVISASPSPLVFGSTALGASSTATTTLTATAATTVNAATAATTVNAVTVASGPFAVASVSPPVPQTLAPGQSVTVTVAFTPNAVGTAKGTLDVETSQGPFKVALQGNGAYNGAHVSASPGTVAFGTVLVGRSARASTTFVNDGTAALTVSSASKPKNPFSASGLPASGTVLKPGDKVVVALTFAPRSAGTYSSAIAVTTGASTVSVPLSGAATTTPGHLTLSPTMVDFGTVPIGSSAVSSFDLSNTGGVAITITLAKAPYGAFSTDSPLPEGTVLNPGEHRTQSITFAPTTTGLQSASYIIAADDGQGDLTETLTGVGGASTAPPSITIVNPLSNHAYSGAIAVQAQAQNASAVTYQVDAGAQVPMAYDAGTGLWAAALDTATVPDGPHNVTVTAAGAGGATAWDRAWSVQFANAPTPTPTATFAATPTPTPALSPTPVPVNSSTPTPVVVVSPTTTPTPTNAGTATPSATASTAPATSTATATPGAPPSATATAAASATATATAVPSPAPAPTVAIANPATGNTYAGAITVAAAAQNATSVTYHVDSGGEVAMSYSQRVGRWQDQLQTRKLANGTHSITVTAAGAGGSSTATVAGFIVAN